MNSRPKMVQPDQAATKQTATARPEQKLSDEKLFKLCKYYGKQARVWRQKFAGLLPEVNKRRLFEKKGFSSIFHFAKILAGMSEEQVRLVLNLEKRLEDKPALKSLLIRGEVSVHKLARVISIANTENEHILARQAKVLPQSALETLVREEKLAQKMDASRDQLNVSQAGSSATNSIPDFKNQNGFREPLSDTESLRAQTHLQNISLDFKLMANLSSEVKMKLLELVEKGIEVSSMILEMLAKREAEIAEQKEKLSEQAKTTKSRYIKIEVRKLIKKEHGTKCSIRGCTKAAINIHHSQRFSLASIGSSDFLFE